MALASLSALDKFYAHQPLPGTPDTERTLFSPIDQLPEALQMWLQSADHSLVIAMFGFTDASLKEIILHQLNDKGCHVQVTLDSRQAGGKGERELVAELLNELPGNSIAIGHSEAHPADIIHLKMAIVDGIDVASGSTNWSVRGQERQDNELTIIRSPVRAAAARARLDLLHDAVLQQMARRATQPQGN